MRNKDRLPALDLLKTFEVAAQHLSFSKAAEELFLSQSAVSRQIQALETQLGLKLFHRRTRALLLTEKGQLYYHDVSSLLRQLREVTARITWAAQRNPLVVTTLVTFASLWLVPRLSDLQQRHPDITVHLVADNNYLDLERNRLDVAIRFGTRQMVATGALKLFGESVVPVCAPALAGRRQLKRPADLARAVLLHYEDPAGNGPWISWKTWFDAININPVIGKGSLRFSHYDQVIRAAVDGQGIALGRIPLIRDLLESGQLVIPFSSRRYVMGSEDRAYWLMVSPLAKEREDVRAFVSWLQQQASASAAQVT